MSPKAISVFCCCPNRRLVKILIRNNFRTVTCKGHFYTLQLHQSNLEDFSRTQHAKLRLFLPTLNETDDSPLTPPTVPCSSE